MSNDDESPARNALDALRTIGKNLNQSAGLEPAEEHTITVVRTLGEPHEHEASTIAVEEDGTLYLHDRDGEVVAVYAKGAWQAAHQ